LLPLVSIPVCSDFAAWFELFQEWGQDALSLAVRSPAAPAPFSPKGSTMGQKVKWIPEGHQRLIPHLVVRGAAQAIAFYEKAFGAKELSRHTCPDSQAIMHAAVQIGDCQLFLNDEFPQMGAVSPQSLNGSPVTLHLWVEDVDAAFGRAVKAGAQVAMPVMDQFWGDRYGMLIDPFGHRWSLATHVRDVPPEEMMKAAAAAFAGAGA
jgi:PhnB protein